MRTFSPLKLKEPSPKSDRKPLSVVPGAAILKGIPASWLIAIVVWTLASARGGHIAIIVIVTHVVGLGRFTHVIAGFVEALLNHARVVAGRH